jgi:hypothetical protein
MLIANITLGSIINMDYYNDKYDDLIYGDHDLDYKCMMKLINEIKNALHVNASVTQFNYL